ncbi:MULTISPECIES: toll/interleukin-1 receptor domain-containing protein [unclassified Actinopolyspora]|uniref:TIR domain-containing protein n=1 Tax=unclassified Actinopolyspora TaxID=2639451 RepID=UPI0013F692E3|nr:toll/interleukin-1 receptor domain-containing protein [Actinopolyspora sp. BKK2]NHE77672.1 toll/interleukin-1 receptor domain-containing protein [Actinopolyspora sp. BKK1]
MADIFVNYRNEDGHDAAVAVERELSRRFGDEKVFRASKSIRPGEDFRGALTRGSSGARVLLVLIGDRWLSMRDAEGNVLLDKEEDWTRAEILNALESGARVIPVMCGRSLPRLSASDLPPALTPLADCQSLRYDSGNAEHDLAKIAHALVELVPGLEDRTVRKESEGMGTHNSVNNTTAEWVVQTHEFHQGNRTNIGTVHGSVHSGDGTQYNNTFNGDGTNYVAGPNHGGISQNFGKNSERERDN